MPHSENDHLLQHSGWGIQFITYLTHVTFYLRFVFIYLLSAFLELMGIGAHTQFWFFLGGMVITAAILYFFVDTDRTVKLEKTFSKLNQAKDDIVLTLQEKLKLNFYVAIEYIFYMSMLFGLARQILLYVVSQQSQAITLMAFYQPVILIAAAYLAIWLTWIHYQATVRTYTFQKAIFNKLRLNEQSEQMSSPISRMRQFMLCLMCLSMSVVALFSFQYYLSAGQVLFPPYMISWMVFAGVLSVSVTFTFLYQNPLCRSLLWCGFIAMSATLGMVFLGKIVYMALLGHLASGFYHSVATACYMGVSVACGVLYSQVMYELSSREMSIAKIYDGSILSKDLSSSIREEESLVMIFPNCTVVSDNLSERPNGH